MAWVGFKVNSADAVLQNYLLRQDATVSEKSHLEDYTTLLYSPPWQVTL